MEARQTPAALAIAEGDPDDEDDVPHAPRAEPAWHYAQAPDAVVEHCLRPRRRDGLDRACATWLHMHLVVLGRDANARACHFSAQNWFECAYAVKDRTQELLSSINMRLRLGQATLAYALYARVLDQRRDLSEAQREMVVRKQAEASAEIQRRAASGPAPVREDELEQLLTPHYDCPLDEAELEKVVPLMRQQAHRANKLGDYEAARLWFDCTFELSQQPADLLSAANMRLKLEPASPLAEALYRHVLALPGLPLGCLAMAERKLQQLQAETWAEGGAAAAEAADEP